MTTVQHPAENLAWYALSAQDVAGQLGVNPDEGLDVHQAERRLEEYGPNALPTEPPPSMWIVVAVTALLVLNFGPGKPSTTLASVNMTMAFAIVSLSAVNIGLVMRRERQAPWASPVFPYLGWIILGWILTWAAVELAPLQRLLDTTSLSGRQWIVVLALSLLAPAVVAVDKVIQLSRQSKAQVGATGETRTKPALQAVT